MELQKLLQNANPFDSVIPLEAHRLFKRLSSSDKELVYAHLENILGLSDTGYLGQGEDSWFNQNNQAATNLQRYEALSRHNFSQGYMPLEG